MKLESKDGRFAQRSVAPDVDRYTEKSSLLNVSYLSRTRTYCDLRPKHKIPQNATKKLIEIDGHSLEDTSSPIGYSLEAVGGSCMAPFRRTAVRSSP
jgi:hypothetical protein